MKMFDCVVRRWCEKHSKEWDDEIAGQEELLRASGVIERS